MTATKFKVAGTAAAVVIVGMAALTIGQHGGFGPTATGSPASSAAADGADPAGNARRNTRKDGEKPLWRALTPAQQVALQPLQAEWDQMDAVRKQKWLQLANRFSTMKPAEQERVHERMRTWIKLTPEQRELARETYTRARKISPDQKNASWESYQQLPEEQKRKLAASAAAHKPPATSSASGAAGGALSKTVASCPAGTVKNTLSATPPCVNAPAPAAPPALPVQPVTPPAPPAPPAQQEKPVPANWGITPNNA
jgi:hypothetical protein